MKASTKPLKPRKCRNKACGVSFVPTRPLQTVCSPSCALLLIDARKAKANLLYEAKLRKETRSKLLDLKPLQYWLKRAEKAFNAYIRDGRDKDKPCISCGTWDASEWHCGHFISVGSASNLRYEEVNCAKQCAKCNTHLSGNLLEMEKSLVIRYGSDRVEALKNAPRGRKWKREELQEIESTYKAKIKNLMP